MVDEIGTLLREGVVQFELLEGLAPPPGAGDEQRAKILEAQAGMRRGLSELVLGCVNSLADADYPAEQSAELLAHLTATLPILMKCMGDAERAEAMDRLHDAGEDRRLVTLHAPLQALASLLAPPPDA